MRYYTQRLIHNTNCTFFWSHIFKANDYRQWATVALC